VNESEKEVLNPKLNERKQNTSCGYKKNSKKKKIEVAKKRVKIMSVVLSQQHKINSAIII
jgi:hypothetical protein